MGKDKYIMSGGISYQMHEFCLSVNVQTKFRLRRSWGKLILIKNMFK